MGNASRDDNNIAARNGLVNAVRIVLVPEAQSRFAIRNAENFV